MKMGKSVKRVISYIMVVAMLVVMAVVVAPSTAMAVGTTYYVDSSAAPGGDGSSVAPWNSLSQVNARVFGAGDRILFKANSSFTGTLVLQGSGTSTDPIKIDMYGSGNKPVINAGTATTSTGMYQNIAVAGSHTYTLKGLGRLYDSSGIGIIKAIEFYPGGSVEHALANFTSTSWTLNSTQFTTRTDMTSMGLYIEKVGNTSSAFFLADDLSLVDNSNPGIELVVDPGFENENYNVWQSGGLSVIHNDRFSWFGYRSLPAPNPGSGNNYLITGISAGVILQDIQYWEINNLDITCSALTNGSRVGVIIAATDGTVKNHIYCSKLNVHGIKGIPESFWWTGGINYNSSGTSSRFNDVRVDQCNLSDMPEASTGILVGATASLPSPSTNVTVTDNSISDTGSNGVLFSYVSTGLMQYNIVAGTCKKNPYGVAMFAYGGSNVTFQRNEVYDTYQSISSAMSIDNNAFNPSICPNAIVQYNYSHNNLGGLVLSDGDQDNIKIRYNISENDKLHLINFDDNNTKNIYVYNNTFYIAPAANMPYIVNSYGGAGWLHLYMYNNIFYDTGSLGYDHVLANYTFNNNCVYNTDGQTRPNQPTGSGNIYYPNNPLFTGTPPTGGSDAYRIQSGSPCRDTGTSIVDNGGFDFWGTVLYQGAGADIGACEYAPGDTIVDFEDRPSADTALTGIYNGIDWGTSDWRTVYTAGCTKYLYANNTSTTEITRTFTLPAGEILKNLKIWAVPATTDTVKVSQPGNAEITWTNIRTTGYGTYITGWTSATGSTVTVKITCTDPTYGAAGIIFDNIVYGN